MVLVGKMHNMCGVVLSDGVVCCEYVGSLVAVHSCNCRGMTYSMVLYTHATVVEW